LAASGWDGKLPTEAPSNKVGDAGTFEGAAVALDPTERDAGAYVDPCSDCWLVSNLARDTSTGLPAVTALAPHPPTPFGAWYAKP